MFLTKTSILLGRISKDAHQEKALFSALTCLHYPLCCHPFSTAKNNWNSKALNPHLSFRRSEVLLARGGSGWVRPRARGEGRAAFKQEGSWGESWEGPTGGGRQEHLRGTRTPQFLPQWQQPGRVLFQRQEPGVHAVEARLFIPPTFHGFTENTWSMKHAGDLLFNTWQ